MMKSRCADPQLFESLTAQFSLRKAWDSSTFYTRSGFPLSCLQKFHDFSMTPKTFFQDSVVGHSPTMFKYTDEQQLFYIYSVTVQSSTKCSTQVAKKLFS